MKYIFVLAALIALFMTGCTPAPEGAPAPESAAKTEAPAGSESGGVTPIAPGGGAMAPVSGSESLDGTTGGGVASSAKDKAKQVAGDQSAQAGETNEMMIESQ